MIPLHNNRGFTLIELIAVVALISLMLAIAVPRMEIALYQGSSKKVARWLLPKVPALKQAAAENQIRYSLNVDFAQSKLWISHQLMDEAEILEAQKQGFDIPEDLRIVEVYYPGKGGVSAEQTAIRFFSGGYSDWALIIFEDRDKHRFMFTIEPFLTTATMMDHDV
jgi:prepilin-type N-terminal cleavage/methylation domain-containing protein